MTRSVGVTCTTKALKAALVTLLLSFTWLGAGHAGGADDVLNARRGSSKAARGPCFTLLSPPPTSRACPSALRPLANGSCRGQYFCHHTSGKRQE